MCVCVCVCVCVCACVCVCVCVCVCRVSSLAKDLHFCLGKEGKREGGKEGGKEGGRGREGGERWRERGEVVSLKTKLELEEMQVAGCFLHTRATTSVESSRKCKNNQV